jgi:spore coat protein A
MTRREFLEASLAGGMLAATPGLLDPNRLPKFVDRLIVPPIARSDGFKTSAFAPGRQIPFYRLPMRQIERKIHRDLPATRMWGFDATSPGPTIEARRGEPLLIEWANELPQKHFLPIDHSIHGAGTDVPEVRTIVHLHGGRVPPESDGYPENWFTPGKSIVSFYPNRQDATMLWYHDHAMGITRLNMFAGLFGLYVIRDEEEDALDLPNRRDEIPLILYDRSVRTDGQFVYPVSGDPANPWVSEFFGEAVLVNGTLFPFLDVEPRPYRFRLLNASNSRFYYLSLSSKQRFWQIGSDQGLMTAPVAVERLTLAPGERADVVIDFREHRGQPVVLASDRYTILEFRVSSAVVVESRPLPARLRTIERMSERQAVKTRPLSLDGGDSDDPTLVMPMLLNGSRWHDPVTENPQLDTVEVWSLINTTDDSHPIHLHLVRFQILDRRPFDVFTYLNDQELRYTAAAVPPETNEAGWKDVVRAEPGMVTRIIVRFEGFAGRYVWHCHVLEHEDFEMMRPYEVVRR